MSDLPGGLSSLVTPHAGLTWYYYRFFGCFFGQRLTDSKTAVIMFTSNQAIHCAGLRSALTKKSPGRGLPA